MTNELMVNDLIMYKSTKSLIKIKGYIEDEVELIELRGGSTQRVCESLNDYAPIPLTAEILRKNGFGIDDSFKPYRLWRSADNRIILHNEDEYLNTFNKWHIHVDTEDMRTIGSVELTYVHQLQQCLRLCGLNSMANNFNI